MRVTTHVTTATVNDFRCPGLNTPRPPSERYRGAAPACCRAATVARPGYEAASARGAKLYQLAPAEFAHVLEDVSADSE